MIKTHKIPLTQRCLKYIQRKDALFSAGPEGAVFEWSLAKIFDPDMEEKEAAFLAEGHKKKHLYTLYLAELSPWIVGEAVQCIVDLPNINFLASGDYNKDIKLWDLRSVDYQGKVDLVQSEVAKQEKMRRDVEF